MVADSNEEVVMVADRIERDIVVDAPVEVVWRVVTEPDQISQWFADTAEIDLRPGGEGTLTWDARATNEAATVSLVVESLEPPLRFAFRWEQTRLVEFTLAAEGDGTRLRVVESGFAALAPEEGKARYDAHSAGWDAHLANVRDYVSRLPQATSQR
jgi:uncharacterized protein YndB with AHSA1/START domain